MMKIKIILRELLLIPLSALVGAVVGFLLGLIYGGNYGSVLGGILGPGYEGGLLVGLLIGAATLAGVRVYFWLQKLKISSFAITLGSFLISSVITYYLFYWEVASQIGKTATLATILILPLLGLLIPTFIFKKMRNKK